MGPTKHVSHCLHRGQDVCVFVFVADRGTRTVIQGAVMESLRERTT